MSSQGSLAEALFSRLREIVDEISDLEVQKRTWLGDMPDERRSFVEAFYAIVNIDIDVIRDNRAEVCCSDKEWERLLRFLVKFLAYYAETNDVYDQEAILSDANWLTVVNAAKDASEAR